MPTATQRRFAPVAQVTKIDGHSSHEVKAIDKFGVEVGTTSASRHSASVR